MKTFTSLLLVNRLLNLSITSSFLLLTVFVSAQIVNTNTLYSAKSTYAINAGIEYASLSATASEKAVYINWVTVSEENNSHFEVERSLDKKAFITVAMVLDGFTASGTGKTYKFKEPAGDIKNGKTVYYRLKQVGTDNKVSYSTIMAVQMNAIVTLFPKQSAANVKSNNRNLKTSGIKDVLRINPNGQVLLSTQSDMGYINVSAEQVKLSAGIFNARMLMPEILFMNSKLLFA
jgi:hypothetical protein